MPINLCDFMTVVADEVEFRPHKADGPMRNHLATWAAESDAFGHWTFATIGVLPGNFGWNYSTTLICDISLAGRQQASALHPLKPLSVPQHVHRERLLLRQVRCIDQLRILNAIGADEDGVDDPLSPQRPEAARAEVSVALSAFDGVL